MTKIILFRCPWKTSQLKAKEIRVLNREAIGSKLFSFEKDGFSNSKYEKNIWGLSLKIIRYKKEKG